MLYTDLRDILLCTEAQQWRTFLNKAQATLQQAQQDVNQLYAVALFSYETGTRLHAVADYPADANNANDVNDAVDNPCMPSRILFFAQRQKMTAVQVSAWLANQTGDTTSSTAPAGIADVRSTVDEAAFTQSIDQIHDYITAGDTYQVNYTYRLHFDVYGSPIALYRRLRERQPVPYGALIWLPNDEVILSFSPELFVQHQQGQLQARPMKGTAAASGNDIEDQQRAAALSQDKKNRAENLMIVDLLRNDLGRVAIPGSVKVPKLFQVERFSSVLQMTSSIAAQLEPHSDLADIMSALFPCGSITGAPKHRSMEIIRELENSVRGMYTGAIGWIDAAQAPQKVGDFCLSVPIRTLHLSVPTAGKRTGIMGVGAGIVHDSVASEEYAECQLKARFLTGLAPEFDLFETMFATQNGARHIEQHLQRLRASALYFGFKFDEPFIRQSLADYCQQLAPGTAFRLRLTLKPDGTVELQSAMLPSLPEVVKVMLSPQACLTDPVLLQHKTSLRQQYDQGWRIAEKHGCFDMLFFNAKGHVTEGGRSNLFLRRGTQWFTPALSDGVLPGIMRAELLKQLCVDTQLQVIEQSLTLDDLANADELLLCNALRGKLRAQYVA
jgi:para-aminobenzoate synthetase/4-amino-4-deoxychorismate lyase